MYSELAFSSLSFSLSARACTLHKKKKKTISKKKKKKKKQKKTEKPWAGFVQGY